MNIQLHATLTTPDQATDLHLIQLTTGIRRKSDLIRYLIRTEAERIRTAAERNRQQQPPTPPEDPV